MADLEVHSIKDDKPLSAESALANDKLHRGGFAKAAVAAMKRVTATSGFVLSIEGPWGSGKTSALAMIEQTFRSDFGKTPIIVRFNPWLIGDRDSLVRQFLESIASAVQQTDHIGNVKKVSKELKNYAKAFDLVKYIPGAEPWASIIKKLMESAGDAAEGLSDQRFKDIEHQKEKLEKELKKLKHPIFVFIDDIDRLFPEEVFEMVRIIKAVGDLPNIGYIVAWDSGYVSEALKSASVPNSSNYLDKIVQIRLHLPAISTHDKLKLLNAAIDTLDADAVAPFFSKQQERLDMMYHFGLKDLLQQPRDITRVFNTISVIEPGLRGELVFADILGLSTLMIRAPYVYDLLRKDREVFIAGLSNGKDEESKARLSERVKKLQDSFDQCETPNAAKEMTFYLFPNAAKAMGSFVVDNVSDMQGHLGSPSRLNIALQLSVGIGDVSLVDAKNYVMHRDKSFDISKRITTDNALEFMEKIGDVCASISKDDSIDIDELAIRIAKLADSSPYPEMYADRKMFSINVENLAMLAVDKAVMATDKSKGPNVAAIIAVDTFALTVASEIIIQGSILKENSTSSLVYSPSVEASVISRFIDNVIASIVSGKLWFCTNPARILWTLARVVPVGRSDVFDALRKEDPSLDKFALHFLKYSFSSDGGQCYRLPEDQQVVNSFCSLTQLKKHAEKRLKDDSLKYPARAAWRAVVEDKIIYGADGRVSRRL